MVSQVEAKNHDFREPKGNHLLQIWVECPFNEAIISENRIEQAIRAATGVPDLVVTSVDFLESQLKK